MELFRQDRSGKEWQSFIVIVKHARHRGKFPLGWNGQRLGLGAEPTRLNNSYPEILNEVKVFLARNYARVPPEGLADTTGTTSTDSRPSSRVDAAWLYANKKAINWKALEGAEVLTASGQSHLITRVDERPWPAGPLLEVEARGAPTSSSGQYNIEAFNDGAFKQIVVHPGQAAALTARKQRSENAPRGPGPAAATRNQMRVAPSVAHSNKDPGARSTLGVRIPRDLEQARKLDASRQFDLLVFDLDDTLLATGHLEGFRGREFLGPQGSDYGDQLAYHARSLNYLLSETLLGTMQADFPSMAFSVVTRAPSDYARVLLETKFPNIRWNSIIAFEDAAHPKPFPDGIDLAARRAGVETRERIGFIGDSAADVLMAYQAGVTCALSTIGWRTDWNHKSNPARKDHYRALHLMPDAVIAEPQDLLDFVVKPLSFLPCLEAWQADPSFTQSAKDMRVDTHRHFNNLDDVTHPNWVDISAMGRYFPKSRMSGNYDFFRREAHHLASHAILAAKDGIAYPTAWAECCANYVRACAHAARKEQRSLVICPIPSSTTTSAGSMRLAVLFDVIESLLEARHDTILYPDLLRYHPGASAKKKLGREERFATVRDHLYVSSPALVQDAMVLVIDDVCTSGATFFYASRYLQQAGAHHVRCLALTQTIS